MAEYIERETLEKFIEKGLNNPDKEKAFGHDAIEILTELRHMPAADVAPVVHGRWEIVIGSDGKEHMVCTECRKQQDLTGVFSYCPNCGAKMDGERSSDA